MGLRVMAVCVLALFAACGGSSEEGLYGGAGGHQGNDAALGGAAGSVTSGGGSVATGGSAGAIATGGSAGSIAGGGAGVPSIPDAGPDVPIPPPVDAGPDGNNPTACPPTMPAGGSPCNIFVNVTDCVYGFKHCVCSVTTWLCVP